MLEHYSIRHLGLPIEHWAWSDYGGPKPRNTTQLSSTVPTDQIFHALEKKIVDLWENKILLGTRVSIDLVSPLKS